MSKRDLDTLNNLVNRLDEFRAKLASTQNEPQRASLRAAIIMLKELMEDRAREMRIELGELRCKRNTSL